MVLTSRLTKRHAADPSLEATRTVTLTDAGSLILSRRWPRRPHPPARVVGVTRRDDVTFDVVLAAARSRVTLVAGAKAAADAWVAALETAAARRTGGAAPGPPASPPPPPPSPAPRRRSSLSASPPRAGEAGGGEPRFEVVTVRLGDRAPAALPVALPPQPTPPLVAVGDGLLLALARHAAPVERAAGAPPSLTHVPPAPLWPLPHRSALTALSAGGRAWLAVTAAGDVLTWGGAPVAAGAAPRCVPVPGRAVAAAVGAAHGVALLHGGSVATWGDALAGNCVACGQDGGAASPPTLIPNLAATAVAAGAWHTAAVVPGGALVAWGGARLPRPKHGAGAAAAAPPPPRLAPRHTTPPPDDVPFVGVAAGVGFTIALDALGRVWAAAAPCGDAPPPPPRRIKLGPDVAPARVTAIAAGDAHGVALTANGSVFVWRGGDAGAAAPLASLAGRAVASISAGGATLAAVVRAGAPHPPQNDAASLIARWLGAAEGKRASPLASQRSVSDDGGAALIAAAGGGRRAQRTRRSTVEGRLGAGV